MPSGSISGTARSEMRRSRREQRIDLRSALMLLLIKRLLCQCQLAQKGALTEQGGVASDLASNVADDAPEISSERPQGSAGALELLGMGIALMLDQREFADPRIAAEELVIGVLKPALAQHLVGEVVGVFEDRSVGKGGRLACPRRPRRSAARGTANRPSAPASSAGAHVDDRVQPRAQEIALPSVVSFLRSHRPLPMQARNHDSRFDGIPKTKLQAFAGPGGGWTA
jgi:hypothetical protein